MCLVEYQVRRESHPQELPASINWIESFGNTSITVLLIMASRGPLRLQHDPEPSHKMAVPQPRYYTLAEVTQTVRIPDYRADKSQIQKMFTSSTLDEETNHTGKSTGVIPRVYMSCLFRIQGNRRPQVQSDDRSYMGTKMTTGFSQQTFQWD